jgi:hypothetical protein
MNRNLKQSIWVLALGIAFTGLSTTSLTAAVPSQQYPAQQDQDRNQNRDRNDNQFGDRGYFQQGLQDSGFRNIAYNDQQDYRSRRVNYFERGLRDGQYDRQYGGNRRDHQQPNHANDLRAYRDGYKHGYRNIDVRYN